MKIILPPPTKQIMNKFCLVSTMRQIKNIYQGLKMLKMLIQHNIMIESAYLLSYKYEYFCNKAPFTKATGKIFLISVLHYFKHDR